MSVIDIEQSKQLSNSAGIVKTIDENALTLILDNVQINQYTLPEQSTARELTANAIDGQREKERALEILTGKAKVEDYYIKRDDKKYDDSNFDASYYDLKYLDTKHNRVQLKYIVGKEGVGWCDKFIVKDYGVGLGGKRLEGYLAKIGYSTKRNTINQMGGFGVGSRVALSLRNDYYTTETVYNGMRFKFNIYSYKVDSLIGKFNSQTGLVNNFVTFSDGSVVYYESTDSLNYTEVIVPCKTHHKDKFKHAVESQLLYFDVVDFTIVNKNGESDERKVAADIVYNSENLIIADQYQYSKPHIVIVKDKKSKEGISYGYISFKEMEMQDMFGSVGFKCPIRQVMRDKDGNEVVLQDGVDVVTSRESIVWSDNTRSYVKNIIDNATQEANKLIEDQLKEDDFLIWLDKAKNALGNTGDNRILRQLVNIIDKTQLSPIYQGDKTIKYGNIGLMLWGLNPRQVKKEKDYKTKKESIVRPDIEDWYSFDAKNCYLQLGATNLAKDFYINQLNGGSPFTTIRLLDDESLESYIKKDEVEVTTNKDGSTTTTTKPNKWTKDYIDKLTVKRDNIVKLIKSSTLFKSYDDIVVPDDWNKKFEENEEVVKENEKEEKLTPAELRKLAGQTVIHGLVKAKLNQKDGLPFKWEKQTIKIFDLRNACCNVYYGYTDENAIPVATILLWKMYGNYVVDNEVCNRNLDPKKINIYRVSRSMNPKFLKNHQHINQFFKIESDKSKTMAKELVEWATAKYIKGNIDKLKFMRNYRLFNSEIAELYLEVKNYSLKYYNDNYSDFTDKYPTGKTFIEGMLDYTSKVTEFQLFVREHSKNTATSVKGRDIVDRGNKESIMRKSLELFGIDTVEESVGYNLEMYDKMQVLLGYAESIGSLFNHIDLLIDISNPAIEAETEMLIKEVIDNKGLSGFQIPKPELVLEPEVAITDTVTPLMDISDAPALLLVKEEI